MRRNGFLATVGVGALAVVLCAAGFIANGVPAVTPGFQYPASNGTVNAAGQTGSAYQSELGGYEATEVDTHLGGGLQPQSVAPTTFQIAALSVAVLAPTTNTCAGATSCAATLNTEFGYEELTTEAVTAGSTFTATITDSAVTAASNMQVALYNGTNVVGPLQLVSVVPAAGSFVVTFKNNGTATTSGTAYLVWQAF